MSCCVYSRGSYRALTQSPLVHQMFFHTSMRHNFASLSEWCESLFEANVKSFNDLYEGRHSEYVEDARTDAEPDSEFADFFDVVVPELQIVALYRLLGRIDYQLCEARNYQQSETCRLIEDARRWLVEKMATQIEQMYRVAA